MSRVEQAHERSRRAKPRLQPRRWKDGVAHMAAVIPERIPTERAADKLKICADNLVMPTFNDQIIASFEYDLTIEVYLKGSDMPFEGIVYQMWDDSFVL